MTRPILPFSSEWINEYETYPYVRGNWETTDNEENFKRILPKISKYIDWKWKNRSIDYVVNNCGLRINENINDDYDFSETYVVLGCSFARGTGVSSDETISAWVERLSGVKTLNFGNSGAGCDTVFYNILWLFTKPKPPKKVFVLWPEISRFSQFKLSVSDTGRIICSDPSHQLSVRHGVHNNRKFNIEHFIHPELQANNKRMWQHIMHSTWGSSIVELDIIDTSEYNLTFNKTAHAELGWMNRTALSKEEIINEYCARDIQEDSIKRVFEENRITAGACHWGNLQHKIIAEWFLAQ